MAMERVLSVEVSKVTLQYLNKNFIVWSLAPLIPSATTFKCNLKQNLLPLLSHNLFFLGNITALRIGFLINSRIITNVIQEINICQRRNENNQND